MMNSLTYAYRSLRHHWPTTLGAFLGTALVAFVLTGAFLVRRQANQQLLDLTMERIGTIHFAVENAEVPFRVALAEQLASQTGAEVAPLLVVHGSIAIPGESAGTRYTPARIIGVDDRFWRMSPDGEIPGDTSGVILNDELDRALMPAADQELVIRTAPLEALSPETGLSFNRRGMVSFRLRRCGHASAGNFGRFSLKNQTLSEPTAFVPLSRLQQSLKLTARANLALFRNRSGNLFKPKEIRQTLASLLSPDDLDVEIRNSGEGLEIRTPRVFLPQAVEKAILGRIPGAMGILTYFVTSIVHGHAQTPYSTVSALPPELLGYDLQADEIVINEWLARDLDAGPGNRIGLTYFIITPDRRLVESNAWFKVKAVVSMGAPLVDRSLAPNYPGMQSAQNCRDWQPDLAIDLGRIRQQDESYWDQYQASPKAGISLEAGQRLWGNTFGNLTSIRLAEAPGNNYKVIQAIRKFSSPSALGFTIIPVKRLALKSVDKSMDAGQIFFGLNLFLMIAALIMAASLWHLHIAARISEIGLFRAIGFTSWGIGRMFAAEVILMALAGAFAGAVAAVPYGMHMTGQIFSATSSKQDMGMLPITEIMHQWGTPVLLPAMGIVLIIAVCMAGTGIRRVSKLQPWNVMPGISPEIQPARTRTHIIILIMTIVLAAMATGIAIHGWLTTRVSLFHFMLAGMAFLGAGFGITYHLLAPGTLRATPAALTFFGLAWANARRARWRSLAVVMLLSCGIFLVVVVGATHTARDFRDPAMRQRHLGGFDMFASLAQPLTAGEQQRIFTSDVTNIFSVVPCRLSDGDDASCLNPARGVNPQLLGVPAAIFAQRQAFGFIRAMPDFKRSMTWHLLEGRLPDGAIPAIVDETTLTWGLGMKLGDDLQYQFRNGKPVRVRIVAVIDNSFLQGHIIIDNTAFLDIVPESRGANILLVNIARNVSTAGADEFLHKLLGRHGITISTTDGRFEKLAMVETIYLGLFGILGTLGLVLGAAGLGFMLLRNIMERRVEIAIMRALGYTASRIHRLLLIEHLGILAMGVGIGLIASLVASWPALITQTGSALHLSMILSRVGLIFCGGIITITLCSLWITGMALLRALRAE